MKKRFLSILLCAALLLTLLPAFTFAEEKPVESVKINFYGVPYVGGRIRNYRVSAAGPAKANAMNVQYQNSSGYWTYLTQEEYNACFQSGVYYRYEIWLYADEGYKFTEENLGTLLTGPSGTVAVADSLEEINGVTTVHCYLYLGKLSSLTVISEIRAKLGGSFNVDSRIGSVSLLPADNDVWYISGANTLYRRNGGSWYYVNDYDANFDKDTEYRLQLWAAAADGYVLDKDAFPEIILPKGCELVSADVDYTLNSLKLVVNLGKPARSAFLKKVRLYSLGEFSDGAAINDFMILTENIGECGFGGANIMARNTAVSLSWYYPSDKFFNADLEYKMELWIAPRENLALDPENLPEVVPPAGTEVTDWGIEESHGEVYLKLEVYLGRPVRGTVLNSLNMVYCGSFTHGMPVDSFSVGTVGTGSCVDICDLYVEDGADWVPAGGTFNGTRNYRVKCRIIAEEGYDFPVGWTPALCVEPFTFVSMDFRPLIDGRAMYLVIDLGMPCSTENYTDVPGESNWAHKGIDFCVARGIMGSTSTSKLTFEPKKACTRAEIASMLYRLGESPNVNYSETFTDVKNGMWYTKAVLWCAEEGIVSGSKNSDGTYSFKPTDKVTREQLAVMMKGFYVYLTGSTDGAADLSGFADAGKVTWSKEAVQWAVYAGILSGKAQNGKLYLDPRGSATRQEVASILMRFCSRYGY